MYAKSAVSLLKAYSKEIGMDPERIFNYDLLDCFDIKDQGSHKYVPSDELDKMLGLPVGAGVFGYVKFGDGSYVLRLCGGQLASWSGNIEDSPEL